MHSQNCALSVHAPSEVSVQHSEQQPALLTKDRADPFQTALQDAKKESSRAGKVPVSNKVLCCQACPTRGTPCGHAVSNLKTY